MFFVFFALIFPIVCAIDTLVWYAVSHVVSPIFKIYQPTYIECFWISGASFVLRTWYKGLQIIGKKAAGNNA